MGVSRFGWFVVFKCLSVCILGWFKNSVVKTALGVPVALMVQLPSWPVGCLLCGGALGALCFFCVPVGGGVGALACCFSSALPVGCALVRCVSSCAVCVPVCLGLLLRAVLAGVSGLDRESGGFGFAR
jgi:hypothetical protein